MPMTTPVFKGPILTSHLSARNGAVLVGIKLVAIIAAIGFGTMLLFAHARFEHWGAPWQVALSDTLILSILSAYFIYMWVFRPIHDQARSNALFATVLNQLNVGVLITDNGKQDNPIIYANPAFLRITGYEMHEVLGRNPRFLKGEDSLQEVAFRISDSIRRQQPIEAVQKNYRKDGSYFWNEIKICPVLDAKGRAVHYFGLSNEVTQRVEMERRLQELAEVVQQAGEAIVVVNKDYGIEFANLAFCLQTGYTLPDLHAMDRRAYFGANDDVSFFTPKVCRTIEAGQVWVGRHLFSRKDGSGFDCLSSIAPIRNATGEITHYVCVHRDITELVELENRLLQAKKMEAVGTLVSGIAHDFNNILMCVLGSADLALLKIDENSKATRHLQAIKEQGHHAADMIRQLLAFARKGEVVMMPTSMHDLLQDAVQQVCTTMPTDIELVCETADHVPMVHGDVSLLQQAVVNLMKNALDAVHGRHHARVEVMMESLDLDAAEISDLFSGADMPKTKDFICVRVRDNGQGMDKDVLERVFDPFFTTKTLGKGTGLGLAMAKGSVEMHMGHIGVSSIPGKGSEFTIILPCINHVHPHRAQEEVADLEE